MAIVSPPPVSSTLVTPHFIVIDGDCPRLFPVFEEFFRKTVESVYGARPEALASIRNRVGLLCEMLTEKETPKAFLVYQTKLDRHSHLELRNFALLDPPPHERTALNLHMLEHVKAIARARLALGVTTFTISREQKEFLELHGFKTESENSPVSGVREFTLKMSLEGRLEEGSVPPPKRQCVIAEAEGALPASRGFVERGQSGGTSAAISADRERTSARIERCTLKREYIEQIRSGAKTYEGRVNTGMFRSYREGMSVCWYGAGSEVLTRIVSVKRFPSFEEMVKTLGYKKLLPMASSESQAIGEYHKIPGYTDKAKQFGAVAFEVEVISSGSAAELTRKRERSE